MVPLRILGLGLSVLAFTTFLSAFAQQPGATPPAPLPVELSTQAIKEGKIYWVQGDGGNAGFVIGEKGVIVIDAKLTVAGGIAMVAEVAKVTAKPITHVILTHSDGDHVNGLAGFPDGLQIIAHANAKQELLAVFRYAAVEIDGGRCLPPLNRIPNQVITGDRLATTIDGVRLVLHHFGPAHTSGDLVVELPDEKIAFSGDLLTNSVLIHTEKMGSFDGWFDSVRQLLKLNVNLYVAGHDSKLNSKEDVRQRVDVNHAIRIKVAAMVDQGMTLAAVRTNMGDPSDESRGCRGIPYPSIAEDAFYDRQNRNQALQ